MQKVVKKGVAIVAWGLFCASILIGLVAIGLCIRILLLPNFLSWATSTRSDYLTYIGGLPFATIVSNARVSYFPWYEFVNLSAYARLCLSLMTYPLLISAILFLPRMGARLKVILFAVALTVLEGGFVGWISQIGYGAASGILSPLEYPLNLMVDPMSPITGNHDFAFALIITSVSASALCVFGIRRTIQVTSLAFIPLPVLVFCFDRGDYGLHVADALSALGIGWFSNSMLLHVSIVTLTVATAYPYLRAVSWKFVSRATRIIRF